MIRYAIRKPNQTADTPATQWHYLMGVNETIGIGWTADLLQARWFEFMTDAEMYALRNRLPSGYSVVPVQVAPAG